MPKTIFDPSGAGFDIEASRASGATRSTVPGENFGHLPSRDPRTGRILKGFKHESFAIAIREDAKIGFFPFVDKKTGAIHTFKKNPDPKRFTAKKPEELIAESNIRRRSDLNF